MQFRRLAFRGRSARGFWQALSVAGLQSIDGVLFPLILLVPAIFTLARTDGKQISVAASGTVIVEVVTMVATIAFFTPQRWLASMKGLRSNRGALFIVLGVLCGTVTGNIAVRMGILLGGSSYGSVLSSMYPLISIGLAVVILKERYDRKVYLWMAATAVLGILFIILPVVILKSEDGFSFNRQGVAILLSLLGAAFWAVEAMFVRFGMHRGQMDIREVIMIRTTFSLGLNVVMVLPLSGVIAGNPHNPFEVLATVGSHYETWLVGFFLGICLAALRLCHTAAIKNIGVARTAVIDSNYLVLTPVLSYVVWGIMDAAVKTGFVRGAFLPDYKSDLLPYWCFFIVIGIVVSLVPTVYYASKKDATPVDIAEHAT